MIYIGIDTGTHTGFAVWDSHEKTFLFVDTLKIHEAMEEVMRWKNGGHSVKVIFEDARQRKYIPREKSLSEYRGKMMGAGSVKRDASIWEDFLKDKDIPYEAIPPRRGLTKWSAEHFKNMTGWAFQTSEHSRDAGMLVFGK